MTGSEIALAEATAAAASLQQALPPSLHSLFGGSFLRSWDLYDEFVSRLTLRVFEGAGLEAAMREPGSTSDVAARAGLDPGPALIPLDELFEAALAVAPELRAASRPRSRPHPRGTGRARSLVAAGLYPRGDGGAGLRAVPPG